MGLTTVDTQTWGTGTQADPKKYEVWGSLDGNVYTRLAAGDLSPPSTRQTDFSDVVFNNTTAYRYYQIKLAGSSDYWAAVSDIRLIEAQAAQAVNIAMDVADLSTSNLPLMGDSNRDGVLSADESKALTINLNITSPQAFAKLADVTSRASDWKAAGVDNLVFSVHADVVKSEILQLLATPAQASGVNGLQILVDLGAELVDAKAKGLETVVPLDRFSKQTVNGQTVLSVNASTLTTADGLLSVTDAVSLGVNAIAVNTGALNLLSGLQLLPPDKVIPLLGDNNGDGVLSAAEKSAVNITLQKKNTFTDVTDGLPQEAFSVIGNIGWDWGWAPWQAFDNNVNTSSDIREADPGRGLVRGLQIDLGVAKTVTMLGLTTRSDLWWGNNTSYDPVKVQVFGSTDGKSFVPVTPNPITLTSPNARSTD
jgi:hypothetical protein